MIELHYRNITNRIVYVFFVLMDSTLILFIWINFKLDKNWIFTFKEGLFERFCMILKEYGRTFIRIVDLDRNIFH